MRKLKYYVASTLDGFICREDGSFDCFPMEGEHVTDFLESYKWFDIVLMGRRTYEVGLKVGVTDPYPTMKSFVFSRTMKESPDPRVELVAEHAGGVVRRLKNEDGKDIWLCGGAELAGYLFEEKLIDNVIIKLNPLLLGSGISLMPDLGRHLDLKLTDTKVYASGVVLLNYDVVK